MSESLNLPAQSAGSPPSSLRSGKGPGGSAPRFDEESDGPGASLLQANAGPFSAWLEGGLALLDSTGRVQKVNESFTEWLEKPAEELPGCSLWTLLAERCPEWGPILEALRCSQESFAQSDLKFPATSGGARWFRLELVRGNAGRFVRLNSILPPLAELEEAAWDEHLRHPSAQREMFVRLLRAEAQLTSLTERWPGVIFSQRADFTFRFVSPRIEELSGVSIADWQSKPQLFWNLVHDADVEDLRDRLSRARATRQPVTSTYRIRHTQTNRVTYVMEHRQPMVSPGGLLLGYEGVWLDVTRQTIAEQCLTSAAWKETLSVLTMSLAHDFGNIMAGIHSLSESFLEQVGAQHLFTEGLGQIKTCSRQASQLVHRIIDLHQGKTGDLNYHNLNELTADLADLSRKFLPRRMQLNVELATEALPVYLDAVEFRQVLIGLILNAVEATPPQGCLVLRTAAHAQLPPLPGARGTPPRTPAACLSVEDHGCGIPSRHLGRLFDPFFTTKPANKGSGLGLYNAGLFVEKHSGAISVQSMEGAGTTVQIWLPQADFTEAEHPPKPPAPPFAAGGAPTKRAP